MTKEITIDVLDAGYAATADGKRFGYTTLDDLLNGLRGLLGDGEVQLGLDFDGRIGVQYDDGSVSILPEGWVRWDGNLIPGRTLPVGLTPGDIVEVHFKNAGYEPAELAESYEWSRDEYHDCIIAYRVVK